MDLQEFAGELTQNIVLTAAEEERPAEDIFTEEALDYLRLSGEVVEPVTGTYRARGARVDAFDFDDESLTLDLFTSEFSPEPGLNKITNTEVQEAIKRTYGFWVAASGGKITATESGPVQELINLIRQDGQQIQHVRLFLLTNRISAAESLPSYHIPDGPVLTCELWDIERLYQQYRINAGKQTVVVDLLRDYNFRLECLRSTDVSGKYNAYLAILPAGVLARIYKRHKQGLLERNVRTFLQFKVDTNRGIRDTASKSPDMFFAYNNGISTTAAKVETQEEDGRVFIARIEDWQIVNGGQTTASLYSASSDRSIDLSRAFVQLKICEILATEEAEAIIPKISQFANKQTAIKSSDFSSNSAYHVNLEKISRSEAVPSTTGLKSDMKWYYERTRGQYLDEEARQEGLAARRKFNKSYPKSQKFTKVDVAKYEMSWLQKPNEVSTGAEKNYLLFEKQVAASADTLTPEAYHQLIARALLFKQIDRDVHARKLGGYKANMVTYILAWLSYKTEGHLDLNRIWSEQAVPGQVRELIAQMTPIVWDHLTNPPSSVRNIGEWCKKQECWKSLKDKPLDLSGIQAEIDEVRQRISVDGPSGPVNLSPAESDLLDEITATSPETFLAISSWAARNNELTPFDRRLIYNVGSLLRRSAGISIKQARNAKRILENAKQRGFSA
ncbi:AIPR family protein [Hymenobacter metallilatus]|uniref:Abortive phage infection protein n=1 Tax=Hymenobacter metallilatus TaxID=2493666 RepID=A0A428J043_9BACT|nr:AIPR family protein [Hymenobacter metallilatus]RSK24922.1 abortive phage infection protein [Hymenobacter metallilatus]